LIFIFYFLVPFEAVLD